MMRQSNRGFAPLSVWFAVCIFACGFPVLGNPPVPQRSERVFPREIRGYKVERVAVETKRSSEEILRFGEASVITITPLGVTIEVPIIVAPVKQKGRVDFLTFYDVKINGTHVEIADYNSSFELPTERELILARPLRIYVAMPSALVGAVLEWASPQPVWPVTGVAYVFGRFKKSLFKFKRVVPVELELRIRNPLINQVSAECRVPGIGCRVSGVRYQVPGVGCCRQKRVAAEVTPHSKLFPRPAWHPTPPDTWHQAPAATWHLAS